MNKPAYAVSPVLLVCLAIAVVGGVATYAYHAGQGNSTVSIVTSTSPATTAASTSPTAAPVVSAIASPTPSLVPNPMAGWKTYTSKTEGISFKYPADWQIAATYQPSGGDELAISGPTHTVEGQRASLAMDFIAKPLNTYMGGVPSECDCNIWNEQPVTSLWPAKSLAIIDYGSSIKSNPANPADASVPKVQFVALSDAVVVTHGYPYAVKLNTSFMGKNGNEVSFTGTWLVEVQDNGKTIEGLSSIDKTAFDADSSVVIAKEIFKSITY